MRWAMSLARRLMFVALLVAGALLASPLAAWAQSGGSSDGSTIVDPTCLLYGSIISVVVTLVKGVGFIKNNPKWVALFASVIVTGAQAWFHGALPSVAVLTACVLTQLAGSVATHEVVVKPVLDTLAVGSA